MSRGLVYRPGIISSQTQPQIQVQPQSLSAQEEAVETAPVTVALPLVKKSVASVAIVAPPVVGTTKSSQIQSQTHQTVPQAKYPPKKSEVQSCQPPQAAQTKRKRSEEVQPCQPPQTSQTKKSKVQCQASQPPQTTPTKTSKSEQIQLQTHQTQPQTHEHQTVQQIEPQSYQPQTQTYQAGRQHTLRQKYIYVLLLRNNKRYVGETEHPDDRFWKHKDGFGSAYTNEYPVVRTLSVELKLGPLHEDTKTLELMMQFGIDNVRGGSFTKIVLPEYQKQCIEDILDHQAGRCFRCKQPGHFTSQCRNPAVGNNKCSRCGRESHALEACYAKRHINGSEISIIPQLTEAFQPVSVVPHSCSSSQAPNHGVKRPHNDDDYTTIAKRARIEFIADNSDTASLNDMKEEKCLNSPDQGYVTTTVVSPTPIQRTLIRLATPESGSQTQTLTNLLEDFVNKLKNTVIPCSVDAKWHCSTCTFTNEISSVNCDMCNSVRFNQTIAAAHRR